MQNTMMNMKSLFLAPLSLQAFEGIPEKVVPRTVRIKDPAFESRTAIDFILDGYTDKLIYKNQKLSEFCQRFAKGLEDPECRACLSQGQRMLLSLCTLDGQLKNGGITQFFWNFPDSIFEVIDGLKLLGEKRLLELYEKAVEGLIGNKDDWVNLREKSYQNPQSPSWEPFQESYDLLDLGWFDNAYFDKYESDGKGNSRLQTPGLGPKMLRNLLDYVKSHKEEFIEFESSS